MTKLPIKRPIIAEGLVQKKLDPVILSVTPAPMESIPIRF
jgi:hypothetical protein